MGTEVLVAAALSAAAAGASAYNTNRTAKKQDSAAAAGIRKQAENQRQANARINRTIDEAAKSSPDAARNTATQQYLQALQRNKGGALNSLSGVGAPMSSAYADAARSASGDLLTEATDRGQVMARMDAPLLQRQSEQAAYGNLGEDLGVLGGNVAADQFLNELRVRGIRRNPWIDAGAAAAGGYASNMGRGGG